MHVINPATEEVLADCPRSSEEQLNEAVQAAKKAFPSWSQTEIKDRKEIVSKIADIVEANAQELAQILTEEQGKPIGDASGEVYGMAAFCRYFASLDLPGKVIEDSDGRKVEAHHAPLGVVGAIVLGISLSSFSRLNCPLHLLREIQ